jgi:hypothetical protein
MKEFLIYAAAGYFVLQALLVMALMAAAAKPAPRFQSALKPAPVVRREEELELVS